MSINWVTVDKVNDATILDEAGIGKPIEQLRRRTDILKTRLDEVSRDSLGSLVAHGNWVGTALAVPTVASAHPTGFQPADMQVLLESSMFQTLSPASFAIGIALPATDGAAVYLQGHLPLTPAELANLFIGDVPEEGPVYLSPTDPGKLTGYATGPSIMLGVLAYDGIILSPQAKDVAEAHIHRTFKLDTKFAGEVEQYGGEITAIHGIRSNQRTASDYGTHAGGDGETELDTGGMITTANYEGLQITNVTKATTATVTYNDETIMQTSPSLTWDTGDVWMVQQRTSVVPLGGFNGTARSYTLTLTDSSGNVELGTTPASSGYFEDVYMHWESTDAGEGEGLVRLYGYDIPFQVGTRGLVCSLRNVLGDQGLAVVEEEAKSLPRRQFALHMPDSAIGWREHRVAESEYIEGLGLRGVCTYTGTTTRPGITIAHGDIWTIQWASPSDGDVMTVGPYSYEFVTTSSPATPGATPVMFDASDIEASLLALAKAVNTDGVPMAVDGDTFEIQATDIPTLAAGAFDSASQSLAASTTINVSTSIQLMIYDKNYRRLAPAGSYKYYEAITDGSDTVVYITAFNADGVHQATTTGVAPFIHSFNIVNDSTGAALVRNVSMDYDLAAYFPPVPMSAAGGVLDGLVLRGRAVFPDTWQADTTLRAVYLSPEFLSNSAFLEQSVASPLTDPSRALEYHVSHNRLPRTSLVTSLRAAAGSAIAVRQCGSDSTSDVGDLELDLDFALTTRTENLDDHYAVKRVQGRELVKAPIVSKIIAGPGVSVGSSEGLPGGTGRVIISAGSGTEGTFTNYTLKGAKQERIGPFPFIRLLAAENADFTRSAFTAWFRVPEGLQGEFQAKLEMQVFGLEDVAAGAAAGHPTAGVGLRTFLLDTGLQSGTLLNTLLENLDTTDLGDLQIKLGSASDKVYTVSGSPISKRYGAYDPIIAHMDTEVGDVESERYLMATTVAGTNIPITPGSMFGIELERLLYTSSAGTIPYNADIGFTDIKWKLIPV